MYYPNGQVWLEYETKNGVKTGKQTRYTETGEIISKDEFISNHSLLLIIICLYYSH